MKSEETMPSKAAGCLMGTLGQMAVQILGVIAFLSLCLLGNTNNPWVYHPLMILILLLPACLLYRQARRMHRYLDSSHEKTSLFEKFMTIACYGCAATFLVLYAVTLMYKLKLAA